MGEGDPVSALAPHARAWMQVRMLSDMNAEATKAMDLGMDAMGLTRAQR